MELVQVHVEGAVETKRSGDAGHYLSNDAVQVGVARRRQTEVLLANVVDGLVINLPTASMSELSSFGCDAESTDQERAVRVLESGVSRQHGIVRLDD